MMKFLIDTLKNHSENLCIPYQTFTEFINTITKRIEFPLTVEQAIRLVEFYQQQNIQIIYPKTTQLANFLQLFK